MDKPDNKPSLRQRKFNGYLETMSGQKESGPREGH